MTRDSSDDSNGMVSENGVVQEEQDDGSGSEAPDESPDTNSGGEQENA